MSTAQREDIEAATEEVSLRDLAHTGLSKVQVMRSTDIERMIEQAVAKVVVAGGEQRGQLESRSRQALVTLMKDAQALMQKAQAVDVTIQGLSTVNAKRAAAHRALAEKVRGLAFCADELTEANRELEEKGERLRQSLEEARGRVCSLQFENRDRRRALARERQDAPDAEARERERDRLARKLTEIEAGLALNERRLVLLELELGVPALEERVA